MTVGVKTIPLLSSESIVVPENVTFPVLAEPVAVIVMLPSASLVVSIPVPPINFILSPVPICP